MDPDSLRDEIDEWVREGIITESQAEEILARYDGEPRRSRVVLALSLVGAALVFAGVTLFLATNWEDFPRLVRALVLVAGPTLAYVGGALAYDRKAPRIGRALCILGAVLVGPAVFLFEELFSLGVDNEWLLFVWAAVAVPTGHALGSRAGTGLGLAILVTLVAELTGIDEQIPVVGALGIVLFVIGWERRAKRGSRKERGPRDERVAWTYRAGGVAITLAALLFVTRLEGRFARFDLDPTVPLLAAAGSALVGVIQPADADERDAAEWATAGFGTLAVSVSVAMLAPETVPELPAFVGVHLASLAAIGATGYLGYRTRTRVFIDLATIAALLQTLSFVAATVVDSLSGSVALVAAGLLLLAAGVALERGRRSILSQM
jgi:uncharacterized membrane protein